MSKIQKHPVPSDKSSHLNEGAILALLTQTAADVALGVDVSIRAMTMLTELSTAVGLERSQRFAELLAMRVPDGNSFAIAYEFFSAQLALRAEDYGLSLAHCERGRSIALSVQREAEAACICIVQGTVEYRRGHYEQAGFHFEEAVVAARRARSRALEGRAAMNLALVRKNTGLLGDAERLLRFALTVAGSTEQPAYIARCEVNLANVLVRRGDWPAAEALTRAAMGRFSTLGLDGFFNTSKILHGRLTRLAGNPEGARSNLQGALEAARLSVEPRNVILALEFLADCDLDLGDPVASRERYREALLLARGHGKSTDLVLECLRGLGAAELGCGEAQTARGLVEESIAIARQQGDSFELGTSLFVLAQVLNALGQSTEELEALHEARTIASTIGDDHGHARASLALARQALDEGRRVDAMTLAAEAHRLFQRIGAEHLIAEAAGVLEEISSESAPGDPSPSPTPSPTATATMAPNSIAGKPRKRSTTAAATITSDSLVPGFITVDPGLLQTLGIVKTLAPRRPNILVHGESGTGKELIAQAVHSQSGRTGPFVPVNCSAFPGDLIEGELFGHARGAYTGADRERVGLFEHAHHGTLFLDEIGDMPIKAQARLLRALEGGEVRRLGENTARVVDVRVVAATHRNLMAMVHAGEFRLDLYYRLAGFVVQIPAVRERPEDAKLLVDLFLGKFAQEQDKRIALAPELREELASHSWPGNVREIRLVMERLVSLSNDGATLKQLPFRLEGAPRPRSLPEALEAEERRRVLDALTTHNWNKQRAANSLGTSRTTLIAKMQRMGIAIQKP